MASGLRFGIVLPTRDFIMRGDPRTYNLPPKPEIPTIYARDGWRAAAVGSAMLVGGALLAFLAAPKDNGRKRRKLLR